MPAAAVAALRGHVELMLRAHEGAEGECLADTSLARLDLSEMLVTGLRYVRHEHPWIWRDGAVIDPFQHWYPWSVYGSDGRGCWGRTHVVVVIPGDRMTYIERVWDVSCE